MTTATSLSGSRATDSRDPPDRAEPVAADNAAFAPLLMQLMRPLAPSVPAAGPPAASPPADRSEPSSGPPPAADDNATPANRPGAAGPAPARRLPQGLRPRSPGVAHTAAAELRTRGDLRLDTKHAMERAAAGTPRAAESDAQEANQISAEIEARPRPRDTAAAPPHDPRSSANPLPARTADSIFPSLTNTAPRAALAAVHALPPASPRAPEHARSAPQAPAPAVKPAAEARGPSPRASVTPQGHRSPATPPASRTAVASIDRTPGSAPRAPTRAGPAAAPHQPSDPAPTEQVQKGLAAVLQQRGGSVTIRLTPDSLGPVRIRLDLGEGRVTAKFEAATDAARRLLEANLDGLRASLEARGLTVDRLDIGAWEAPAESRPHDAGTSEHTGGAGDDQTATEDPTRREAHGRADDPNSKRGSAPAEPAAAEGPSCVVTRLGLDAVA